MRAGHLPCPPVARDSDLTEQSRGGCLPACSLIHLWLHPDKYVNRKLWWSPKKEVERLGGGGTVCHWVREVGPTLSSASMNTGGQCTRQECLPLLPGPTAFRGATALQPPEGQASFCCHPLELAPGATALPTPPKGWGWWMG